MRSSAVLLTIAMVFMAGCTTLSLPFNPGKPDFAAVPQDLLREVAAEIERAIYEGNREASFVDRGGIVINDENVSQAIRTRAARSKLVDEFRASGHAWEKRSGLVAILRTSEYKNIGTRRDRDRKALLIVSENNDRWVIYEGIRKNSGLPGKALSAIQVIFQEARLELMDAGQKYEAESGDVAEKAG